MIKHNYHTHTFFCDGKESPKAFLKSATDKGFETLGFSAHAEVPFDNEWSIRPGATKDYVAAVNALKSNDLGVEIILGLEADYIPGVSTSFNVLKNDYALDYIIGSVHLVKPVGEDKLWFIDGPAEGYENGIETLFKKEAKVAVKQFYFQSMEMLQTQQFDIIGHLDKVKMNNKGRYFSTQEKWYKDLVSETLRLMKEKNVIMEVNTRGKYKGKTLEFFPAVEIVREAKTWDIPILISSDAHHPLELNLLFDEALEMIRQQGYAEVMQYCRGNWIAKGINEL